MYVARYKMLEDGSFFGEIPSCPGVQYLIGVTSLVLNFGFSETSVNL